MAQLHPYLICPHYISNCLLGNPEQTLSPKALTTTLCTRPYFGRYSGHCGQAVLEVSFAEGGLVQTLYAEV